MLTTFKATAKKFPDALKVETKAGNFKVIFDEPVEDGGTNSAVNPIEGLLCALSACQSVMVASFAAAQNFKYEDFHIEVEGDFDSDGFMGLSDVRPGFLEIRSSIHFKTDETPEKAEKFVKFIEKTCPVADSIANGVKLICKPVIDKN